MAHLMDDAEYTDFMGEILREETESEFVKAVRTLADGYEYICVHIDPHTRQISVNGDDASLEEFTPQFIELLDKFGVEYE
jgi:DNA-binding NarL/FixJ family response regulator